MEKEFLQIVDVIQEGGLVTLLIILVVPRLRRLVFGNGNGGDAITKNSGDAITKNINALKNNHLHDIKERLEDNIEVNKEILFNLKELRRENSDSHEHIKNRLYK
tara:strand:+ start:176 stop:490 length:315 start_codon:yes stop_codon:yes gene_type:complete